MLCRSFVGGHMFSVLLGMYLRVDSLDLTITLFHVRRNYQTVFQSSYTILCSYQQFRRIPVSPIPYNPCYYLSFFLSCNHPNGSELVVQNNFDFPKDIC